MITKLLNEVEEKMKHSIDAAKKEFAGVRTGRANPGILDRVMVEYYNTLTPLNQLGSITVPDARTLLIQPWDKTAINAVEKAILKADLGLNPANDGTVIRIAIPPLTEERRKELVKLVKKEAEEKRVMVRNLRRDANERIKQMEKDKEISEDEARRAEDSVQKLTNKYIEQIDKLLEHKEKEIMEV